MGSSLTSFPVAELYQIEALIKLNQRQSSARRLSTGGNKKGAEGGGALYERTIVDEVLSFQRVSATAECATDGCNRVML